MKKNPKKSLLQKKWVRIILVSASILLVLLIAGIISACTELSIGVSLILSALAVLIGGLFLIKFAMFPIGLLKVIADKLTNS